MITTAQRFQRSTASVVTAFPGEVVVVDNGYDDTGRVFFQVWGNHATIGLLTVAPGSLVIGYDGEDGIGDSSYLIRNCRFPTEDEYVFYMKQAVI